MLGKSVLGPLGPTHSPEAGEKEREREGAAPKPGNHGQGAALGTCCKGFFWLLEALAASQVLILGYFQPLSIPLCCVCPSSSCYPDPCIVTPLCSCSLPLPSSSSPSTQYFLQLIETARGHRILTHWGLLTYKTTGRGSPSHAHTQRHKARISKSKGPSLGSDSLQSF